MLRGDEDLSEVRKEAQRQVLTVVAARVSLAATTPPLLSVVADDPKCCPRLCDYRPGRVAYILRMLDEMAQSGYEPCEALMSALDPPDSPYERRTTAFGPSEPTGAKIVADIWRALRAGKRDPVAIASFLCPFSTQDEDC